MLDLWRRQAMSMAKSSMATMMRAGTRKVRMYSWCGTNSGNSGSSVGSAKQKIICQTDDKNTVLYSIS